MISPFFVFAVSFFIAQSQKTKPKAEAKNPSKRKVEGKEKITAPNPAGGAPLPLADWQRKPVTATGYAIALATVGVPRLDSVACLLSTPPLASMLFIFSLVSLLTTGSLPSSRVAIAVGPPVAIPD